MNIGAHVRGGGKLIPSLEAGVEIGATSIQVFTQSPRMWKPSQYAPEVLGAYREAQAAHPTVKHTFCHATYLINLASADPELYERSVACLTHNVGVGRGMGASGVVLHVGSHLGAGFEGVVAHVAQGLLRALDDAAPAPEGVADCPILIENAAGTGGTVGRSFEEIEAILDAAGGDERLGLCIDTQHLWASGFDYSTVEGATNLVKSVDKTIGLRRLRCFHLNDSKIELGGNRDRHANIGEGTIGAAGLAPLVGHPAIRELALLLEVPGSGEGPRAEDVLAARDVWSAGVKLYDGPSSGDISGAPAIVVAPVKKSPKKSTKKRAPAKASKKTTKTSSKSAPKNVAKTAKKSAKKVKKSAPSKVAKSPKKSTKKSTKKSAPAKASTKTTKTSSKRAPKNVAKSPKKSTKKSLKKPAKSPKKSATRTKKK